MKPDQAGRSASDARDDASLMRDIAKGKRDAFTVLYQRYQPRLCRYLIKYLRDPTRAEDITDDVLFDVWKGAESFQGRSSVSTWIFGIAHNKAVSDLRHRREDQLDEARAAEIADPTPDQSQAVEAADVSRMIRTNLEKLSPEHREVLELTYFQEFSIREIAAIIDRPENTVKTRMHYARRRLGEWLQESGIEGVGL